MNVRSQPPPDDRLDCPPPPGHHWEWVEPDPARERLITGEEAARICRRTGCHWDVAWALHRSNGWWLYCAEHHYGRKIEDGRLVSRRAVRNTESQP